MAAPKGVAEGSHRILQVRREALEPSATLALPCDSTATRGGCGQKKKGKKMCQQKDAQTPRVSGSATDPKSLPYLRSLVSAVFKQRQSSGPVPLNSQFWLALSASDATQ